jgi:hypothetical protein
MNRFFEVESVQRPIEDIRGDLLKLNAAKLAGLLSKTDWYVVRAADPSSQKEIPQAMIAERQAHRDNAIAVEGQISSANTYDEMVLIFQNNF